MSSGVVVIIVGKKRKEFQVHKKLICDSSKFFSDAFNGKFREAKDNKMYMPEDDAKLFSLFLEFLYRNTFSFVEQQKIVTGYALCPHAVQRVLRGRHTEAIAVEKISQPKITDAFKRVPVPKLAEDAKEPDNIKESDKAQKSSGSKQIGHKEDANAKSSKTRVEQRADIHIRYLLELYFFGEKLLIRKLKNGAIDYLRRYLSDLRWYLGVQDLQSIWINTSKDSCLRKYAMELTHKSLPNFTETSKRQLIELQQTCVEFASDFFDACQIGANVVAMKTVDFDMWIAEAMGGAPLRCANCGISDLDYQCLFHDHAESERCPGPPLFPWPRCSTCEEPISGHALVAQMEDMEDEDSLSDEEDD